MYKTTKLMLAACAGVLCCSLAPVAQAGLVVPAANTEIADAGIGTDDTDFVDIASSGTTLYAVWLDERRTQSSTEADVFFSSSTDGGQTWRQNKRVSDPDLVGFTDDPTISVAPDGSIWVAWGLDACFDTDITCGGSGGLDNDVLVSVSRDGGTTWTENRIWNGIDGGAGVSTDQSPQLHAENDKVFALVHDPRFIGGELAGFDVYLVAQTLTPTAFSSVRLTTNAGLAKGNFSNGPNIAMAMSGNTVCAAWEDQRDLFSIYGTCSTNRGQTFPAATRWSTNGADTIPKLALAPDGNLFLAYKDDERKNIVLRVSSDSGASWGDPRTALNIGDDYSYDYDMTVGPDNQLVMPVAVGATSSASASNLNVVTSIDSGQSFGLTGPLESGNQEFLSVSTQRSVAVATGGVAPNAQAYFAWNDDRYRATQRGNSVWFATGALDATPPTAPRNARATDGDTSALVQWDPATDTNGVAYYNVLRASTAAGPFSRVNARPVIGGSFRDVGLAAGTYVYRVVAVDRTANAGPPSNDANATVTVGGVLSATNGVLAYDRTTDGIGVRTVMAGALGTEAVRNPGYNPMFATDGSRLALVRTVGGQSTVFLGDRGGANFAPLYAANSQLSEVDLPVDTNFVAAIHTGVYNGNCIPFEPRLMRVTPPDEIAKASSVIAINVAISPDRRWLAYTYKVACNAISSTVYDSNRLCLLDTTRTADNETCQASANFNGVDFGNTGNIVVFSADYSSQNEIWRAEVTQTGDLINAVQLTRGSAGQPSTLPRLSTDGNWVVFMRDTDAGPAENLQVHVVRADGDSLRNLGIVATNAAWSGGGPAGPVIAGGIKTYLPTVGR